MDSKSGGSVTEWLEQWKGGDQRSAQRIWERYYQKLLEHACHKLNGTRRRVADEEDVVLAAFHSFLNGAREGRFPKLHDRDDLWQILLMLTDRKAKDQVRRLTRKKRGGGDERGESAFGGPDGSTAPRGIERLPSGEPTPQFAAQSAEEFRRLLDKLPDESLRQIALLKLQGDSNREIAHRLGCVEATVERKLKAIRSIWSKDLP